MLAAAAWRRAALGRKATKRILLLGPTHRIAIRGVALPGCDQFGTPAGMLAVPTQKVLEQTQELPLKVTIDPLTHREEHALEVQVPLIIENFGEDVQLIPLNVGEAAPKAVAEIIAALTDEETLLLGVPPGSAALSVQRMAYLESGRLMEISRALYRSDAYDLVAELTMGPE